MSTNGKVLNNCDLHLLSLFKRTSKSDVTLTRINNKNIIEKSVLDYFIVKFEIF